MHNCHDDVLEHHDQEVSLPQAERSEMHNRRDANRNRLRRGLGRLKHPQPWEYKCQGSYAMKTMVQDEENDYDIDDGVYFQKSDLVGARSAELSALQARQRVRDAVDDGSFKSPPEVRTNCVRVNYDAGYHVDLPVYRRIVTVDAFGRDKVIHELAGSDWKRSDARDVTEWFDKENRRQSPDDSNGRQLRRVTRQIKKFARSRESWRGTLLSGFGITKLVTECFLGNAYREDQALYDTMQAIHQRLERDLVVEHPVTPNTTITSGSDDPKARRLKEKLKDALDWLKPTLDSDCTRETALKCWDKVFNTDFFGKRNEKARKSEAAAAGPSVLTAEWLRGEGEYAATQGAVQKEGGGRYA